jgi:hypothetical protein
MILKFFYLKKILKTVLSFFTRASPFWGRKGINSGGKGWSPHLGGKRGNYPKGYWSKLQWVPSVLVTLHKWLFAVVITVHR